MPALMNKYQEVIALQQRVLDTIARAYAEHGASNRYEAANSPSYREKRTEIQQRVTSQVDDLIFVLLRDFDIEFSDEKFDQYNVITNDKGYVDTMSEEVLKSLDEAILPFLVIRNLIAIKQVPINTLMSKEFERFASYGINFARKRKAEGK